MAASAREAGAAIFCRALKCPVQVSCWECNDTMARTLAQQRTDGQTKRSPLFLPLPLPLSPPLVLVFAPEP